MPENQKSTEVFFLCWVHWKISEDLPWVPEMWINEAGEVLALQRKLFFSVWAECWTQTGQQVNSRWFCNICPQQNLQDEQISFSQRQRTSYRTHRGSAGSIKDLLGKQRKRQKLLLHIEKEWKNVPVSDSLVWTLICRLWFKLRIKSPRGPEPTCSPYPFVQTSAKLIESVLS